MNKKVHLNETIYFGEDGNMYSSLKEARSNSDTPEAVTTIRKQNCKFVKYSDLPENLKEEAADVVDGMDIDVNDTITVISCKGKLLFVSDEDTLAESINIGLFSDVEETEEK